MPSDPVPPAARPVPPATEVGLTMQPWVVRTLGGEPVVSGQPLTLIFRTDQLSGHAGCNSYSGTLVRQGEGGLTLGPFIKGQRMCSREADVLERRFLSDLERVSRAEIAPDGTALTLFDAAGRALLEAVPG